MAPRLQELPAEGSREVVERELARTTRKGTRKGKAEPLASGEDIERLFGDTGQTSAILALRPSLADVEEAALWHQGDGDMLGKDGHPLQGKAAAIFDLLQVDREEPER